MNFGERICWLSNLGDHKLKSTTSKVWGLGDCMRMMGAHIADLSGVAAETLPIIHVLGHCWMRVIVG